MAQVPTTAMAYASPTTFVDIPKVRDVGDNTVDLSGDKLAALLTPPNSISPGLSAHGNHPTAQSPPPINIENEMEMEDHVEGPTEEDSEYPPEPTGTPLSKGALCGLDASAAITPAMLAKHHLPGIMLGNGPRPIRYVMGELTQSVPGFSRIQAAKARRLVVAALESRHGGGVDGNVAFCKTGWGRWDAHIKGSSKDSGIGSFNEGHLSPPRSERSSYCMSNGDSAVHMPGPRKHSRYRDHQSRGSWTASDLREEDELDMDMDMDVPEMEADKMSLDGSIEVDDTSSTNDDTDDDDWAALGPAALRKASLPPPGAPRLNYNALSIQQSKPRPSLSWSRRPSGFSQRSFLSTSLPHSNGFRANTLDPSMSTPEDQAAAEALISLGSM